MRVQFSLIGKTLFVASICGSVWQTESYAQSPTDPSEEIQRKVDDYQNRKELEQQKKLPPSNPTRAESQSTSLTLLGNESIRLKSIQFKGATIFTVDELNELIVGYLMRPLSDEDLSKLLRKLNDKYQNAGYFLSKAFIPEQDLKNGVLKIQIIEGYIGSIEIHGPDKEKSTARNYLSKVLEQKPTKLKSFEKALLLINDAPGILITDVSMSPSETDIASHILKLELKPEKFAAGAYTDNRGTKEVGKIRTWLSSAYRFHGGKSEISATTNFVPGALEEINYLSLSFNRIFGTNGIRLNTRLSGIHVNSGGDLEQFDRETNTLSGSVSIRYSLMRLRINTLWASIEFDMLNHKRDTFGNVYAEDRLRIIRTGLSYIGTDKWNGINFLSLNGNLGLDIFNATELNKDNGTRFDADGRFFYTSLAMGHDQKITENLGLEIAVKGQYAFDPLPSSEELALGGYKFGRAFDGGEVSGEHGIATSLEVYYEKSADISLLHTYRLYSFYDHGFVWNDYFSSAFKRSSLRSLGAGFNLSLEKGTNISFEAAKPIARNTLSNGNRKFRYFFALGWEL